MSRHTAAGLAGIAAACTIAACSTSAELRAEPPVATYTSARPAIDVATCITDKWERTWMGTTMPVELRPASGGYTVLIRHPTFGHVWYLVDVAAQPGGSAVSYHKVTVPHQDPFDRDVAGCI